MPAVEPLRMSAPLSAAETRKRQLALYLLSAVIVAIAVPLVFAPAKIPVAIRALAGLGDLMAATFVLLAARQLAPRK